MDLYHHSNPLFTKWIIESGLLHANFVVVDVGCQGGKHVRWDFLNDKLEFYGFDPIREVIDGLRREAGPHHTYFEVALGDEDGEREFFVSNNTFSSSFFGRREEQANGHSEIARGARTVVIKRLDSLFKSGALPSADYIKLDCEGFEPEILRGGREYLAMSRPICVTTETSFNISDIYPHSHFQAIIEILVEHRLLVADLNIVRTPRPAYSAARAAAPWPEPDVLTGVPRLDVGAPTTLDVVFCRDFVAELFDPARYGFSRVPNGPATTDQLIKAMINFELHGLMDCAYEIAIQFREQLSARLDVSKAAELLLIPPPHARNTADVFNCLMMIAQLRSRLASATKRKTKYSRTPHVASRHVGCPNEHLDQVGGRELLHELRRRVVKRFRLNI